MNVFIVKLYIRHNQEQGEWNNNLRNCIYSHVWQRYLFAERDEICDVVGNRSVAVVCPVRNVGIQLRPCSSTISRCMTWRHPASILNLKRVIIKTTSLAIISNFVEDMSDMNRLMIYRAQINKWQLYLNLNYRYLSVSILSK